MQRFLVRVQSLVCAHQAQLEEHGWTLPLCAQCGQRRCHAKVGDLVTNRQLSKGQLLNSGMCPG